MRSETPSGNEEILIKLFGSISRVRILQLLLSNANKSFYQREIMYETGLTLHPTQHELNNLVTIGIITKREIGDRVYYQINKLSPFFKPIKELFEF